MSYFDAFKDFWNNTSTFFKDFTSSTLKPFMDFMVHTVKTFFESENAPKIIIKFVKSHLKKRHDWIIWLAELMCTGWQVHSSFDSPEFNPTTYEILSDIAHSKSPVPSIPSSNFPASDILSYIPEVNTSARDFFSDFAGHLHQICGSLSDSNRFTSYAFDYFSSRPGFNSTTFKNFYKNSRFNSSS